MKIYNSVQEIGCRILLILVTTKKKMSLETISTYDYFSIHINDLYKELLCLHPNNPNHSSEIVVRRMMLRDALSFLAQKGLVQVELSEKGIYYFTDSFSEKIVDLFDNTYSLKYQEYVCKVNEYFKEMSEEEISKYVKTNISRWKSNFEGEEH
ncbi:ABC-three component system middle component 2 [Lacrimispora sp.]|uniref:ABC-three component system middle component 2 n=1 Tax=Lacrimispora sp. TaxID=2719234 RepID=UPI0029E4198F|nr:hypothetical protein [Lacrimispora sp.]